MFNMLYYSLYFDKDEILSLLILSSWEQSRGKRRHFCGPPPGGTLPHYATVPSHTHLITDAVAFENTVLDLPLDRAKLVCFCCQLIFYCLMAASKGTAVVKIGICYT